MLFKIIKKKKIFFSCSYKLNFDKNYSVIALKEYYVCHLVLSF